MKYVFFLICLGIFTVACNNEPQSPLDIALQSEHPAISKVMERSDYFEVQILYTQIERDSTGKVSFKDHSFRLDSTHYFYPASTVKFPTAVLALEIIEPSHKLHTNSTYYLSQDTVPHSIADDVRQIFTVSDNAANNRLYELMGRDYINGKLTSKGIPSVRIAHRLSVARASYPRLDTLRFTYQDTFITWAAVPDSPLYPLDHNKFDGLKKGKGFMRNDSLIDQPMDFSEKNHFPLQAQHELMKRIFFPENFEVSERIQISEATLQLLKKHMHLVPRKNGYEESDYYDGYCKFFLFGDTKERIPDHIKIYNKVGYAYGTLTDTAYIVDEKEGIDFLLSATILVNQNGIFNDDTYEYDEIGIPFLAQLGREIHRQEKMEK
ncbi:serine hydrolase [Aureisphaera galaxeae]|uniref:serine hydrolase n=1 Tax=Aureisphaera galaxeae TaxID=1538023 RepID=UPI0023503368|nr:serine hydrolase [Aureisphaera galaxeae]MDC8003397.1 serine hydrolase [Aureisphaera galaxeae]